MMRKPLTVKLGTGCLGLILVACGAGPLVDAARTGTLTTLRDRLREAGSGVESAEVLDLAEAVLAREIKSSAGEPGVARILEMRPCARRMQSDLAERAEADESSVAAAAYHVLLEANLTSRAKAFRAYSRDRRAEWQALAARAAVGPDYGQARRAYFVAPDLRVRRAALYAALEAPTDADAEALLDVARHDPDTLARSVALQAIGAIGGRERVEALRDLWPGVTAELRQAIVGAWSRKGALQTGGRSQLVWVVQSQTGLPALVAARALLVQEATEGDEQDYARAVLLRALRTGTADEARLAAALLPLDEEVAAALGALAPDLEESIAVVAWGRLIDRESSASAARGALLELAGSDNLPVATGARHHLARRLEPAALPAVRAALSGAHEEARVDAALQLWAYGYPSEAAMSLADDAPSVRTRTACGLLVAHPPG